MNHNELFDRENIPTVEEGCSHEAETAPKWYVNLQKEEMVAFRMLTARLLGPLRSRIPSLVVSVLCFFTLGGYAIYEWIKGYVTSPDPVLLAGAALMIIPILLMWIYIPARLKKEAARHYDRSVQAGMDFCGELVVYPDCIEKIGQVATARIRLDGHTIFIENEEMMVLTAPGVPAIVLPGRCLTNEMANAVRQAADRLPVRNRRFIARVRAEGQTVSPPAGVKQPQEKWVSTFTYTAEEYATVLKGILLQHFWRMAPVLAAMAMMISLFVGYDGVSLLPCIGYFVAILAALVVFNLVLPLSRVKRQAETLSPHDMTMQVRMDTMKLHIKMPKGAENWILWCDVNHVYERDDFVEIVHNKHASLYIPKRVIDDLDALDTIVKGCRGEQ